MLDIPGIGSEQVRLYGHKFLPQIRAAKRGYDAMMESENRPQDPNHENVIDISSDDGDYPDLDEGADDLLHGEDSHGERSQYFQPDKEVEALYAQRKSPPVLSCRNALTSCSVPSTNAGTRPRPIDVQKQSSEEQSRWIQEGEGLKEVFWSWQGQSQFRHLKKADRLDQQQQLQFWGL